MSAAMSQSLSPTAALSKGASPSNTPSNTPSGTVLPTESATPTNSLPKGLSESQTPSQTPVPLSATQSPVSLSPTPTASLDVAALAAAAASAGLGLGGAIGGGIVAVILLAAAAVVAFYVARRTRRRRSKALATIGQKQRERQLKDSEEKLKDEVAAAKVKEAALEAQLAEARSQVRPATPSALAGGGISEEDVARALAAAGVAGNPGIMASFMAALQGGSTRASTAEAATAAKKPVDALNAGYNPMAVRQQSLRSLSKQGVNTSQVAVASHGALSRAASSQRPAAGAVAQPDVANADFARGAVVRSSSSRTSHAPVLAVAAPSAQKKSAAYTPVWSDDHNAYYYVHKETSETAWELDAAELARVRAEAAAAGAPMRDGSAAPAATPAAYMAVWSEAHSAYYFIHKQTEETAWELDAAEMARVRAEAKAAGLSPLP